MSHSTLLRLLGSIGRRGVEGDEESDDPEWQGAIFTSLLEAAV